jgi:hypothetical protein
MYNLPAGKQAITTPKTPFSLITYYSLLINHCFFSFLVFSYSFFPDGMPSAHCSPTPKTLHPLVTRY